MRAQTQLHKHTEEIKEEKRMAYSTTTTKLQGIHCAYQNIDEMLHTREG